MREKRSRQTRQGEHSCQVREKKNAWIWAATAAILKKCMVSKWNKNVRAYKKMYGKFVREEQVKWGNFCMPNAWSLAEVWESIYRHIRQSCYYILGQLQVVLVGIEELWKTEKLWLTATGQAYKLQFRQNWITFKSYLAPITSSESNGHRLHTGCRKQLLLSDFVIASLLVSGFSCITTHGLERVLFILVVPLCFLPE